MNTNAVIVKQLKERHAKLSAQIVGIEAALVAFGASAGGGNGVERVVRKRKKRTLTPEHIAKMQAARRKNKEPQHYNWKTMLDTPGINIPTGPAPAKPKKTRKAPVEAASLAEETV